MTKGQKIKAILFDLDGTLRDSRSAINPAFEHALKVHNIQVEGDDLHEYIHSLRAVHGAFAGDLPYEKLRDTYDEKLFELLHTIVLYEHAREVLKDLKGRGYKLGLVSSSRFAREAVEQDDLAKFFDVIISGLDTNNHKPHPEPVHMALKRLKISPNQSVMVGDLAADIQSGKDAGTTATVAVTHGFGSRKALERAGADHIIDSLAELPGIIDIIEQNDGS